VFLLLILASDLEDAFERFGRIRRVDMKTDYAFVEFDDDRDAEDALHDMNGAKIRGVRISVEEARGGRGGAGGRSGPSGSDTCFNCGKTGHWASDCTAGDWSNRCYNCGEKGHTQRECRNPHKRSRSRSRSRSPAPRKSAVGTAHDR